jgi:biopolymer transport protein TolR
MGFSAGDSKHGTLTEMNVVPLIDILLVLLIIFMVITPVRRMGLSAQVPPPAADPDAAPPPAIVVQVMADGSLRMNQEDVAWTALGARLKQIFADRAERVAFIRGDAAVEFSGIAQALDLMHSAGVDSVGLLSPGLEPAKRSR